MTYIQDMSLEDIMRFVEQKFNVRLSIEQNNVFQGTSSEMKTIMGNTIPPAPPMQTMNKPIDTKTQFNDPRRPQDIGQQANNNPVQRFNAKSSWAPQPQQLPPRQSIPPPNINQNIPQQQPLPPKIVQQQPPIQQSIPQHNVPPVSFYQKPGESVPQQQVPSTIRPSNVAPVSSVIKPPVVEKTIDAPTTTVTTTTTTNTGRKGSVLDRWSGFQSGPKISPGTEEALRLTAHVNVKERREEIERLMKAVESKFTDNDFTQLAQQAQESQKQSMMKTITSNQQGANGANGQRGGAYGSQQQGGVNGGAYGSQQQQHYNAPPQDEEEPSMLNVPDTLLYSLQINTILQLLAMRQWREAKANLRALQPYVQAGTKEDIFVRIVWSVFYNNYGVDLANQNNFRKAATKAQKGQALAESIGLQSFRFIDHEYSYWAVLLNTGAILAQALHRDNRHVDCARVHANSYNALIGVQKTTNPNSTSTVNKTKMYAVNAIIFGIHAMDKQLLSTGVDLLYPLVQYDMNLRPLLGHGYKNIGILELKANNNDAAKRWFDAAMTV